MKCLLTCIWIYSENPRLTNTWIIDQRVNDFTEIWFSVIGMKKYFTLPYHVIILYLNVCNFGTYTTVYSISYPPHHTFPSSRFFAHDKIMSYTYLLLIYPYSMKSAHIHTRLFTPWELSRFWSSDIGCSLSLTFNRLSTAETLPFCNHLTWGRLLQHGFNI